MSELARFSRRLFCGIRIPAWGAGLWLLLPVLGSGAEEEGPIPRLILGGERATVASYPFVVYIRQPPPAESHACTGSIIAPSWVLTAAHCLVEGNNVYADNSVRVQHSRGEVPLADSRTSKRIILHPKYKPSNGYHYDIALIELSRPYSASFSAGLDIPRRSAEEEYAPSGTSSVTVGFGSVGYNRYTLHPNFVRENLYHAKDCRDRLNISDEWRAVHDDTICSGTRTRRINFGDSGGPLIVSYSVEGNTRWLQVGVTSRFAVSAPRRNPNGIGFILVLGDYISGIYTRTSSYADWIHSTTQGAASLVSVPDPDEDDTDEITRRLSEVNAQISSLQVTAQSLQDNRDLLKQRIDEFKNIEGQDQKLGTTEDGILNSLQAVLAD